MNKAVEKMFSARVLDAVISQIANAALIEMFWMTTTVFPVWRHTFL